MKFIYKLIIRKLKEQFKNKYVQSHGVNPSSFEYSFYQHYFLQTSERLGVSLEKFFDPLNSRLSKTKTLNNNYLKIILQSEIFRKDTLKFLESGEVVIDYCSLIERKITQLIQRFDKKANFGEENHQILLQKMVKYFRFNRQCKLPWKHNEVTNAIQEFKMIILNMDESCHSP